LKEGHLRYPERSTRPAPLHGDRIAPSGTNQAKGGTGRTRVPEDEIVRLRAEILAKLSHALGKDPASASDHAWFQATALALRDRIVDRSRGAARDLAAKQVYYFSLEFLPGRLLSDALGNLGCRDVVRQALAGVGVDLDRVRTSEPDAALGNGGLGRLAACFMESMASLGLPAMGYGIRYDYGLFRQIIEDGWQREVPEPWLARGNPWEFERRDVVYSIRFGGQVERIGTPEGAIRHIWHADETVLAAAYDTVIVGWRGRHANTLRLWSARAPDPLRLDLFNGGDHVGAQAGQARAEAISRVLYPSDATPAGQELRLKQEFFFTSASLQDLLQRHLERHRTLASLPRYAAIQLNDTHPALAVAELMRLLVDEHGMLWEQAWRITTETLSYTNHTLMPEALETWPVALMERLLPRHMQIIYLINWLHLEALNEVGRLTESTVQAVSLIDEQNDRRVRMGHLAFLGSRKVNGVSALHTDLMRRTVFRDLHALYPDRIVNKTNGITFRRWLHQANPDLTRLLIDVVGERVLDDPEALSEVVPLADDSAFQHRFATQRHANKVRLASTIADQVGIAVDPTALFDVHIKRIHEYKRQLLNILHAIALYQAMRLDPAGDWTPRVKIFAGKAAASYAQAKLIIKLIHDVARVVNADPVVADRLKIVFLPNYSASLAEAIIPASDVSEQISTAGMEASGTGNMKLALNGALTIGTLDGANIEIRDRVGPENIVIFGLTADQVERRLRDGIHSRESIGRSPRLSMVLESLAAGLFSPDDRNRYRSLVETLTERDRFMVTADFEAYWAAQRGLDGLRRRPALWWRKSILNTARMGWFSSDRTIREYDEEIWRVAASGEESLPQ
jgi:starch phosphorylase